MIYKFNEVILITLYDFDETTDEAVLVRVEGAKTPVPPPYSPHQMELRSTHRRDM